MAQMTTNISTKEQEVLDRWEEIKNAPEVEITDELRAEVLDKIKKLSEIKKCISFLDGVKNKSLN